jgi:DNA-binding CsgD family transcriptional regulator
MPSPGALLATTSATNDVSAVMTAAAETLRAWVGLGPAFLATADPATGAFSGTFAFDIPDAAATAFYANELSGRDVVRFTSLAEAVTPIGSLYAATEGQPQRSARWREVISPLGWGDELRAAIRFEGTVWGYLCLHRDASDRRFTGKDVVRVANVLPVLGGALRRVALAAVPDESLQLDTGVMLFDQGGGMIGSAGGAAAWLDELGPAAPDGLPLLVAGLAHHVLASGRTASSAITTRSGRAGVLEAAVLVGSPAPQVVVVISAAPPTRRLDLLATASGLTPRELQVVECVLSGQSTKAIAVELGISAYTVQAHLTSIFTKTGRRSRRDLINWLHR